jgi:hypothetical protein
MAIFPLLSDAHQGSRAANQQRPKRKRSICTAPVTGEQVCFPLAEQAALLLRRTEGRKDEWWR